MNEQLKEENEKLKIHLKQALEYIDLFEWHASSLGCLDQICEDMPESDLNYDDALRFVKSITK